jgi:PhzF family phenazine biosynthesis protein
MPLKAKINPAKQAEMGSRSPQPQYKPHTLPFTTLDVFTSTPYSGNPLALIRIPSSLASLVTQTQKQLIAQEFNLSETIFLHEPHNPAIPEWKVDIFTTDAELPFAGHPTIGAAAYVLSLSGEQQWKHGTLVTRAGPIKIALHPDGAEGGVVTAEIPHNVHIHKHTLGQLTLPVSGLSSEKELRDAEFKAPIVSIVKGMTFLLVELESLEALGRVRFQGTSIDFHGVLDKEEGWGESFVAKYYFVVLKGNVEGGEGKGEQVVRVRTRMLEADMEDPATGSAASALGSWLALREGRSTRFEVTQGVEMGRRSGIGVTVSLDGEGKKVVGVRLSGSAVVVMEGTLRV